MSLCPAKMRPLKYGQVGRTKGLEVQGGGGPVRMGGQSHRQSLSRPNGGSTKLRVPRRQDGTEADEPGGGGSVAGAACRQSGLWRSWRAQGPAQRGRLWGRLEWQPIFRLLLDRDTRILQAIGLAHWGKTKVAPVAPGVPELPILSLETKGWGQEVDWKHPPHPREANYL